MSSPTSTAGPELALLVRAAQSGDNVAWAQLVGRFDRMLHGIARSYRLSAHDVDDAVQATWIKLYAHVDSIRESAAIAGWLATTVRRESLRLLQTHVREQLTDDLDFAGEDRRDGPEATLLVTERRAVLERALASLPERQRRLMTLMADQRDPDYREISAELDMPIGSIGPIRARSLARLQRNAELRDFANAA
jgi:RNA polymerase sigma factor (sigma-70 family)